MDRLRAKPPSKDEGKWSEGFLKDIMEEEEKAVLRDGDEDEIEDRIQAMVEADYNPEQL
ncbi:hypothetical protein HRED_08236 [Candidatus Haloredivivus sp. G17]|nr:hypothetical protein HRED_08236 [Candidatus Haloredivivus sp. G17]